MLTRQAAAVVLLTGILGFGGVVHAEGGIVQNASKDAVKGAVKGVQQELNQGETVQGAKQMAKGMIDGVSNAVPTMTSQMVNQANVNRKAMGQVAGRVSADAAAGAVGATVSALDKALGKNGEGPLADTMAATNEKVVAAVVRGIKSEIQVDGKTTEQLTAAAVRGAMSEMHFNISVWPIVLAVILGGLSTLLFGVGLMVLYMLFQKRREVVVEKVVEPAAPAISARPLYSTR